MARALTNIRWSFGLRQLFLWTAAIALALVALRSASTTWVAGMLGLAFVTLTASIQFAIFRQGPRRAFWMGFATFGWAYLLLLLVSWTLGRSTVNDSPLRAQNLPTQQLASGSYHWLYDEAFEKYNVSVSMSSVGSYPGYGGSMGGMGGDMYGGGGMAGDSGMMSSGMPGMPGGLGGPVSPPGPPPGPNVVDFVNVAHALWTLLFAAIGGCLAYWLYMTGPGRIERQASVSS
jgi:hypothetical protein